MAQRLVLPQHASEQDRALRTRTLWSQQQDYTWAHTPGQPSYSATIPASEAWTGFKKRGWDVDITTSLADLALSTAVRFRHHNDTVESFKRYYPIRRIPGTAHRWSLDAEFARQRLNGVNPYLITQMTAYPKKFPVNRKEHKAVIESLLPGLKLGDLLKAGRLFWVDFHALEGIKLVLGRFMVAPCALFWVDERKRLMPLAVQLGQDPKALGHMMFTPKDQRWTWLTARTHVACADAAYHEVAAHLLRTHMVGEAFWVAAARTLPAQHPLHELLRPHFTSTIEINEKARTQLIAPGGPIDLAIAVGSEGGLNLLAQEWGRYSFDAWDPREEFERRGVLDADVMPGYWFRDDALAWFEVIERYVTDLLCLYYADDKAVLDDAELQAWGQALLDPSGASIPGLRLKEGRFASRAELLKLVTQLIYTVSIEHSAVNNGQYDQFGWIPNTPGAMYLPPPTDHSSRSEANFVYALPPSAAVGEQLTLVHLLSEKTLNPMGRYDDTFFIYNEQARLVVDRFRGDIATLDARIRARNKGLDVPYEYLLPEVTGRSIGT